MRWWVLISCLIWLLVTDSPAYATLSRQTDMASQTHKSEQTLRHVQISSTTSDSWRNNWPGQVDTVAPQTIFFDLQLSDCPGHLWDCVNNTLFIETSLNIIDEYALRLIQTGECDMLNEEGIALYHQFRFKEAANQLEAALACYQQVGDRTGEWVTLSAIGLVYHDQGRYSEALEMYQQALAIVRKFDDRTEEWATLSVIGLVYHDQGRYSEALEVYQQALAIVHEVGDLAREGTTLNVIGAVYKSQGQYSEALKAFQQALAIAHDVGNQAGEGTSLNNIGSVYYNQGRYGKSLEAYQQALAIAREVGDQASEGAVLNNIGGVYDSQGRYGEALEAYQRALAIAHKVGDRAGEGITLSGIGGVYQNQGQYDEALEAYQQALLIAREVGDQTGEGATLTGIGLVYHNQGRYDEALTAFQQALTLGREVGDRTREGDTLNGIGLVYHSQGRYGEALMVFQQALTVRHEIGDLDGEGATLNGIGLVYHSQGRYDEALERYQQALAIARQVGHRAGEGIILNNIGAVYYNQEQYDEALVAFQQALAIRREIGDRAGEVETLTGTGAIYQTHGRYGEALEVYQQALAIARQVGYRAGEGTTLNGIGAIYWAQERYDEALEVYQQALVIARQVGHRAGEGSTLSNIGAVYDSQGQYDEALELYRQAIDMFETVRATSGSEVGRSEFIAQRIATYHVAIELLHQEGRAEEAFLVAEQSRGRAFLDSLVTGQVQLADEAAAALLAQEQELYAQRQTLQDKLPQARAVTPSDPNRVTDLEQQLAQVKAAYKQVQVAIATRGAELASLVPGRSADYVLRVDQVQPLLDRETTLISYFLLENQVLAFILTSDNFQTVSLDVDPTELVRQIIAFRDFSEINAAYPDSAVSLYNWLIEPLKGHLTKPRLVIIPHQMLHYLPFAALTDGQRYLIDDYTITILPTASVLPFIRENVERKADSSQPAPLILGNPMTGDYDAIASLAIAESHYRDQLSSLPFAEKEAKAIAKLFGMEPLIGESATETSVREHTSTANLLHLAAHGTFNPAAPLNSLIALAPDNENDGWLTMREVYGLDLHNTDLVVLSACETNLGDLSAGDELVGLTRSFIFAGTPSVIASLWNVEDEATALLMERFYTHLGSGMSKAAALRQAQIEVREQYPNPYYWAAFVLSGDGGPSPTAQRLANPSYRLWLRLHRPHIQPWVWGTLIITMVIGLYIALAHCPERSIVTEKYGRRVQTLIRDPRFSNQVRGLGVAISVLSLAFIVIYWLW